VGGGGELLTIDICSHSGKKGGGGHCRCSFKCWGVQIGVAPIGQKEVELITTE